MKMFLGSPAGLPAESVTRSLILGFCIGVLGFLLLRFDDRWMFHRRVVKVGITILFFKVVFIQP